MTRPLTPLTPAMTLAVTFALLVALTSQVEAKCDFPDFLQIKDPWAGDYRNGLLVAYVKQSYILLRETVEGGNFISFRRECRQKVPDNKYLVMHKEKDQSPQYLCMEFIQRGANIVQVKTSKMDPRQSQDLCDEKEMAIDPFPLVQMGTATPTEEPCPFRGGYNFFAYYALPNNTLVCNNLLLLMRIESECEQGGGITINFRKKECVPKGLPEQAEHRAHCVTHWTQGPYTFVVLRHAEESDKWFCLRTSDPLSNIQDAYLWMEVVIDTSEEPDIKTSRNYLKLQLTNRIFSSTCADEIEICAETTHYCNMGLSRHCAHTCRKCSTEYQIGSCTFEEQFRGHWMESNTHQDNLVNISAYSLKGGHLGKYDCLNMESDKMPEKRVLLELYNNGCFPRYACVEMEKVTSSVMKFRVGKRHMWPLPTSKGQKELICRSDNFQDKTATRSRYVTERPARLLVNTGDIREVSCGLPLHLQGGVAFSEVGIHCGGCLKYDPQREPNKFVIRPVNCSEKPNKAQGEDSNSHTIHHHRTNNQPIEYSCLAHFTFHNSSHAVVTKTTSFEKGLGQYLVWIFTADNQIKVLKAADTFVFEKNRVIKSDLLQAQFTILRNNNMQCQQIVVFPRLSTPSGLDITPRPNHRTSDFYDGIYGTGPPTSGGRYVTYNPMIVNRSNNDDPSKVSNPSSKPDVKPEGPPEPEKPGAVKGPENAAVGAHAQGRNWKRCAAMFLSVFVTLVAKHLMTSSRTVDTLVAVRVT